MTTAELPELPKQPSDAELLERTAAAEKRLRAAVATAVVGQDQVVELMLITLAARGHALLVGVPGLAKTLLVSSLAKALDLSFGRVQFTPDLLPADITGTDVLTQEENRRALVFAKGPIFHNLVLADEVNRTPPKTQAALLEAMQERRVTLDGTTHALSDRFMVVATQNPIESQGVYPLPEAQLDRFLFKLLVAYPSVEEEAAIVRRFGERSGPPRPADFDIKTVADAKALGAAQQAVKGVTMS